MAGPNDARANTTRHARQRSLHMLAGLSPSARGCTCQRYRGTGSDDSRATVCLSPRPKFRAKVGKDPELIVATSGYWDISSWWKHLGNFSRQYQAGVPEMKQYVSAVAEMVRLIRVEFPTR